ncbi:adenylate kinase family protein [Micromonospora sp. NPDC050397]|uniref:adenylate kinase family protein n=1 Tax=Micromonospora sp. NPDC050397 TaxID=3364279 RepID=UPI00384A8B83
MSPLLVGPTRLAVLGPPGSDKDIVTELVAARLGLPAIRLDVIAKAAIRAKTPAGIQATRHMSAGELVPRAVVLGLVRDRLAQPDAGPGFVLCGLPNLAVPATALDSMLAELGAPLDRVVDLVLTDAEVLRRLTGRRMCRACGTVWHTGSAPPARPGVCDRCGGELPQRYDDSPERVTGGLASYRPATAPALDHYHSLGKLLSVDATPPPTEIATAVVLTLVNPPARDREGFGSS